MDGARNFGLQLSGRELWSLIGLLLAMCMNSRALLFTGLVAFSISSLADDWPQFRGPHRDNISKETGLLKQWPEGGPKLVWQNKEAGEGWGAPAVVGDTVYMIGNHG